MDFPETHETLASTTVFFHEDLRPCNNTKNTHRMSSVGLPAGLGHRGVAPGACNTSRTVAAATASAAFSSRRFSASCLPLLRNRVNLPADGATFSKVSESASKNAPMSRSTSASWRSR